MRSFVALGGAILWAALATLCQAQDFSLPAPPVHRLPAVASSSSINDARVLPASYFQGTEASAAPAVAVPCDQPAPPCTTIAAPCSSGQCGCGPCNCGTCLCPEKPAPCVPCPRINLINPSWNLMLGGVLEFDMLFNSARPVAPGVPFFLAPGSPAGASQDTFDAHARQTALYAAVIGPEIGAYKAGGLILANLFNDAVIVDRYGLLPIQAYGDLKNEDWRFAAGLQIDIFAPVLPTVLPFSYLAASGNAGVYRGQVRAERFIHLSPDEQLTLTAGLSDPIATTLNNVEVSEDNGWPNIELRAAWAVGPLQTAGLAQVRPFEVGISSVVGQLRTISGVNRVVANVWGLAGDFRWRVTERWGVQGEIYSGQALGTYGAAIFQNVNSTTFEPVHVTGGWLEGYYYYNPCLHSHVGLAIDDPVDSELAPAQIAFNRTIFANLIWDVSKSFRLAGELTFRQTNYITLTDNDGVGFQGQAQWRF